MSVLPRTAVVVVHGIGEQKPLDTLMSFVGRGREDGGLLEEQDANHRTVAPDLLEGTSYGRVVSVSLEHRVAKVPLPDEVKASHYTRDVDFYEYYWAYRFRDTAWRHLPGIVRKIVSANRHDLGDGSMRGSVSPAMTVVRLIATGLAALGGFLIAVLAAGTSGESGIAAGVGIVIAYGGAVAVADHAGVVSLVRALLFCGVTAVLGFFVGAVCVPGGTGSTIAGGLAVAALAASAPLALAHRRPWALAAWGVAVVSGVIACIILDRDDAWISLTDAVAGVSGVAAVAVPVLAAVAGGFALRSLGDAARYLSSDPENVREREAVRAGLMTTLRSLTDDKDPVTGRHRYDRIVLVGHSLGTVIAYDALQAFWATAAPCIEVPFARASPPTSRRTELLEEAVLRMEDLAAEQESRTDDQGWQKLWLGLQPPLYEALKADAVPTGAGGLHNGRDRWIVSDLVTLACPLTHADVLVASGADDLCERTADGIFAAAPPRPARPTSEPCTDEDSSSTTSAASPDEANSGTSGVGAPEPPRFRLGHWDGPGRGYSSRFHQAAVFAPTRWTNMYITHDLVGGPLAGRFGPGVKDVPLGLRPARVSQFALHYPHSSYWGDVSGSTVPQRDESLLRLRCMLLRIPPVMVVSGESGSDIAQFLDDVATIALPAEHGDQEEREKAKAPPLDFELRVLLKTGATADDPRAASGGCSHQEPPDGATAWVWPGREARIAADRVHTVARMALGRGLSVTLNQPRAERPDGASLEPGCSGLT